MTEKIGNVVLDMTYYPGEDHYSDGDIAVSYTHLTLPTIA